MSESLFVFLAHGVAEPTAEYRPGARHALMIYATGKSISAARLAALARAEVSFWTHLEVKREKEIASDVEAITDEALRTAARSALTSGVSIVVYRDEISLDS